MRRLGEWTRAERLGGGGYAQVFRARGPAAPDAVALKVFDDPTYVNTHAREVSALEAMAGAAGTPRLVDHGRDRDGNLCIVTTLVSGRRLDRLLLEGGPLSADGLAALARQVLAVLAVAHGHGLLHKDIKTSNILADGDRYSLIDWGVAEPVGDGRAESIRAKQDHVAPECYWGRHGPATDFYSLGWLVVEAASGVRPYHFDENRDADYRVAAHCLERPQLPPALPTAWRPLVACWIARDPPRRLQGYDLDELLSRARELPPHENDGLAYGDLGRGGYLRQAAEAGIPFAQHELAARLLKAGGRDEATFWLGQAARGGYARSACRLAAMLIERGAASDIRGARELLLDAGAAGNGDACYRLGKLLLEAGDVAGALAWLKRAADGGHRNALYRYARTIDASHAESRATAIACFEAAAERGHPRARLRLAELAGTGEGGSLGAV